MPNDDLMHVFVVHVFDVRLLRDIAVVHMQIVTVTNKQKQHKTQKQIKAEHWQTASIPYQRYLCFVNYHTTNLHW